MYSTGRRASKALSDLVHKFLKRLEEGAGLKRSNVLVKNTEELFYAGDVGSDVRRLFSYPASVQVRRVFFLDLSPRSTPSPLVSTPRPLDPSTPRLSCAGSTQKTTRYPDKPSSSPNLAEPRRDEPGRGPKRCTAQQVWNAIRDALRCEGMRLI